MHMLLHPSLPVPSQMGYWGNAGWLGTVFSAQSPRAITETRWIPRPPVSAERPGLNKPHTAVPVPCLRLPQPLQLLPPTLTGSLDQQPLLAGWDPWLWAAPSCLGLGTCFSPQSPALPSCESEQGLSAHRPEPPLLAQASVVPDTGPF